MFACVKDGKALGSIRVPAWAQPHETFAAEELARYIKKATGADVPLVRSLKRVRRGDIVVADLSCPATPGLLPAKIGNELRYDGFRMRTVKGVLHIVSNEAAGVVFGAYEYLKRYVGCAFLDYGAAGENVPRRASISHASPDVLDNPRIWYRGLQASPEPRDSLGERVDWMAKNGFTHLLMSLRKTPVSWEECREWLMPELRKRGLKLALGHHIFSILLPRDEFLPERPDFYAKIKGKRLSAGQLNWCLSNEDLLETAAARVIALVRKNPEVDVVELWPDDGVAPTCECRECAALDDPRDAQATDWPNLYGHAHGRRGDRGKMRRYLHLANRVAERLAEVYPRVRLNVLSYADLTDPPVQARVHPNIIICLAIYWRCARHNLFDPECPINRCYRKCIQEWLRVIPAEALIFYDYYMGMGCWSSLPYPILTNLFNEWDAQVELGMGGSHVQSATKHIGSYGINYLAFARLAREDHPTLDEFLDSYCRDFFGPGAEPMARVYRVWEKCSTTGGHRTQSPPEEVDGLFTGASVKACRRHISRALALTSDALYRRRIERVRALVDYIQLWREMPEAYRRVRKKEKISARARADCLAWIEHVRAFVDEHLALDDGIFPSNPADRLLKGWLEQV